jgi:hypothetical protein
MLRAAADAIFLHAGLAESRGVEENEELVDRMIPFAMSVLQFTRINMSATQSLWRF